MPAHDFLAAHAAAASVMTQAKSAKKQSRGIGSDDQKCKCESRRSGAVMKLVGQVRYARCRWGQSPVMRDER